MFQLLRGVVFVEAGVLRVMSQHKLAEPERREHDEKRMKDIL